MTRVLVTNDDGIDAPGIRALTAALVADGHEPLVVAPNRDYSGAGASVLSLTSSPSHERSELRYERRELAEAPGVEAYALDGPPALCALVAMREAFGPQPTMCVSGINLGLNVGPSVMHSGTVSAALTASRWNIPSLAVSSEFAPDEPGVMRYDTAAEVAVQVLDAMIGSGHTMISLNVPRRDVSELAGLRSAPLAPSLRWRSFIESVEDGVITRRYEVTDDPLPADTDAALVAAGFATVSALVGVDSAPCDDLVSRFGESAA